MASTLVPCLHECEPCSSPIPTNLGSTEADMKTVSLQAVSGCRRVQFICHSEHMSSGDSIHCSAVFVWGWGKHMMCNRVYYFSTINTILLIRSTTTANTSAHIMQLNSTPARRIGLSLLVMCYHYSCTRTTRVPTRTFRH